MMRAVAGCPFVFDSSTVVQRGCPVTVGKRKVVVKQTRPGLEEDFEPLAQCVFGKTNSFQLADCALELIR